MTAGSRDNAGPPPDGTRRTFTSQELFGQQREIAILHAGVEYRLRITTAGKLILTK